MHVEKIQGLSLLRTADSGQCFRMNRQEDGSYLLAAGNHTVAIREESPGLFSFDCPVDSYHAIWQPYLDVDTDYELFHRHIPKDDAFLQAALRHAKGLRLLRQDPWEALICFIISQRKSIPAIKGCVEKLCQRFGQPIGTTGHAAFPTPEALAGAEESELRSCALGYRAPYIAGTARMVAEGKVDLQALRLLPDQEVLAALCLLPGVGVKVANCVLLFGYARMDAFPRDVWIQRIESEQYGGRFPEERYPGCAGLIQQYMFYFGKSKEYRQWKEKTA